VADGAQVPGVALVAPVGRPCAPVGAEAPARSGHQPAIVRHRKAIPLAASRATEYNARVIRIMRFDEQWRGGFVWTEEGPDGVEIVDSRDRRVAMGRVVNRMRAAHPGEVLREAYLVPWSLSVIARASADA
jgi:hypothetical protein